MGLFIRVTLGVAAAIVAFAALLLVVKLLFVAAILAVIAIGTAFVVRFARRLRRRRFTAQRAVVVTALTARR